MFCVLLICIVLDFVCLLLGFGAVCVRGACVPACLPACVLAVVACVDFSIACLLFVLLILVVVLFMLGEGGGVKMMGFIYFLDG